jgi:PPM family protein phosphatase
VHSKRFSASCAYLTHRGFRRAENEDAILVDEGIWQEDFDDIRSVVLDCGRSRLFAVADGLGRHGDGAVASRMALERLRRAVSERLTPTSLKRGLRLANEDIYKEITRRGNTVPMGTTVAGVMVTTKILLTFNVGDSRVYKIADGVVQLSQDDRGQSSDWVTQCLGGAAEFEPFEPHMFTALREASASILICTDGVSDYVTRTDLESVVGRAATEVAQSLRDRVFASGAPDNLSLIVLRFET